MKFYQYLKAAIDICFSIVFCILFLPIIITIAVVIKLESKGPAFFKQKRVGRNKKIFYIYKFRTMRTDTPSDMPTHMLADPAHYITRFGKFLRKSSLDEIPQVFNIIKGEMSFIGPRPALWNQYDLIDLREKVGANNIRPGITGWAQVNGRDELPIDVKAKYDGEYYQRMNLIMDIKIVFKTLYQVIRAKGIVEGKNNSQTL